MRGALRDEFADDGIVVRSLAASADPATRAAHYLHSLPHLVRHGGNIPPLVALDRGADLRVVALSWTDVSLPMLALPESGIACAADLRGRRIAVPRRPGEPLDCWRPAVLGGIERILAGAGLRLGDVRLVDIPVHRSFVSGARATPDETASLWGSGFVTALQREEVAALVRGEVDAIFSEGGMAVAIASLTGARAIADLADRGDPAERVGLPLPSVVSVSGALADERPDLVARWLACVIEAADWAARHPVAIRRVLAQELGIAEDQVAPALSADAHRQLGIGLGPALLAALSDQADLLLRHGFIRRPLRLADAVDPAPLERARAIVAARAGPA
jgi:ABC-type nitrate/sulfonate/bicarbonate transport system substrate-binding protein